MGALSSAPGLSSFVGRARELAEISALLREHRVVTLTGPGGSGKTRLAIAVAARLSESSGEDRAVWFVDLSAASPADLDATRLFVERARESGWTAAMGDASAALP